MGKVLYEKKFPDILALEIPENPEDIQPKKTFADIVAALEEPHVYVVIPERIEEKRRFIETAKLFSEMEQCSIEITEGNHEIIVHLQISILMLADERIKLFSYLLGMADDMTYLSAGKGAVMTLTYYTHELFRNGEKKRNVM